MTKEYFEQQVLMLADAMYRVSAMLLRRAEDQKDAVQSCLLKAWERRVQLREESRFRPWVMRILINECHTLLRKSRGMVLTDIPEKAEAPVNFTLRQSVEALPLKLREVVALHYMEGWPVEDVAQILRIPGGTVKSRLSRARALLRNEWQDEEERA